MAKITEQQVEDAKRILKEFGYYVDNLWHIDDVHYNYICTTEEAQEVLDETLRNDWMMQIIHDTISDVATLKNIKHT
jgi:hypothetical protein